MCWRHAAERLATCQVEKQNPGERATSCLLDQRYFAGLPLQKGTAVVFGAKVMLVYILQERDVFAEAPFS